MYKIIKPDKIAVCCILLAGVMLCSLIFISGERAASAEQDNSVNLPIIMYHSILKDKSRHGRYVVSPEEFEKDLEYLVENGYTTIVMEDVIEYVNGCGELPAKPIVLTFDDGYYNNYTYAYPLLEKYDAKIVISVVGAFLDLYTKTPDTNPYYAHLDWKTVEEMHNSGRVEFQNHSYDLHHNTSNRNGAKKRAGESSEAYKAVLTNDLMYLQEKFEKMIGCRPTTFTYPFGAVSDASVEIIKELGFSASLSCAQKTNFISRDSPDCLYRLNRFIRTDKSSIKEILE